MTEKKLSHKQKSSIKFVEENEPKFLRDMKAKMGFRAPPIISDKFKDDDDEDDPEHDDMDDIKKMSEEDRPQIVVIDEKTDINKEKLEEEIEEFKKSEDRRKIDDRQIVFRKPVKHQKPESETNEHNSSKKAKINVTPTNSRLLSFEDDNDE